MLGIVIANWNGEKLIDECLKSLENQSFKAFKLYIIDNNSKDKSKEVIKRYNEKLNIDLTEMNYNSGFAQANNIGIKKAINDGCQYILTLNNDAAGLNFKNDLIPLQVGFKESASEILSKEKIEIEGVCAGAAIYSVKALEAVKLDNENYFDSNFFAYFEDVDLSLRLKSAGFKAKILKDSIVYHMHSATGGKTSGFKEYYLTRNLFMYTKRNQSLEEYNKHKKEYYIRFLKTVIKNINNFNAVKSAIKGLNDGLKESKKIEYWKVQ